MYTIHKYLREVEPRKRMLEFSHGAMYMVGYGKWLKDNHHRAYEIFYLDNYGIDRALEKGLDVFRAYQDWHSMPLVLDVEMFSAKGSLRNIFCENQHLTYRSLEPIHRCIMDLFAEFGITPLVIATGQGYQYTMRMDKGKSEYDKLVDIGKGGLRDDVIYAYTHIPPGSKRYRPVEPVYEGGAFNGVGKLFEWFSNEVIWRAPHYGVGLPVSIGDIFPHNYDNVGINMDLSCFEAPIFMRDHRVPFSTHQKQQVKAFGNPETPVRVAIPRVVPDYCDTVGNGFELSLPDMWRLRSSYWDAKNYARNIKTEMPESAWGVSAMIDRYRDSALGSFHHAFDMSDPNYDERYEPGFHIFNHNLLDPNNIRKLSREVYDYNPRTARQLARYIAKHARKRHWQEWDFNKYPAETKYNFWCRAYCGQLHSGMRYFDIG